MSAAENTVVQKMAGDEEATQALAARLARTCEAGDCILLNGDLGAGKTTFARGFIRALTSDNEEIVSPTFTLVQTYGSAVPIYHFDLYRLESEEELTEIGLDEALQSGITLIEWPELARDRLPQAALKVDIISGKGDQRHFTFAGAAPVWEHRLKTL